MKKLYSIFRNLFHKVCNILQKTNNFNFQYYEKVFIITIKKLKRFNNIDNTIVLLLNI